MTHQEFNQGDVVRVKDPEAFLASFASKVKDRDAVIVWRGNGVMMPANRYCVRFQKRNGRGKEFDEVMNARDLILIRSAEVAK